MATMQSKNENNKQRRTIVIVGAGPAGLCLAHDLIRRPGYDIVVLEKRVDPTTPTERTGTAQGAATIATTRSFPIALNRRGLTSLEAYPGLLEAVEDEGVYLSGICLHNEKGDRHKPRTIRRDTPTLSVDRNKLTLTLLQQLQAVAATTTTRTTPKSTLSIQFDTGVEEVELAPKYPGGTVERSFVRVTHSGGSPTKATSSIPFDYLVAADGGRSKIRQHLVDQGYLQCTVRDVPNDYRTIFLQRHSEDGTIRLDDDKLHGWTLNSSAGDDGGIKIMTAPVVDGCLSGAIIFKKGADPFVEMQSPRDVQTYFAQLCPSSLGKLVSEEEAAQLLERPTSSNLSVRCNLLHYSSTTAATASDKGQVLLLGDAGHAVSASAGQGCNSALQDVHVLSGLLDRYDDDWDVVLPAYTAERLDDAHAVSEISDYSTPLTAWMKVEWVVRTILGKVLPAWLSRLLMLRPMPMELLMDTALTYSEVLRQTQWWVDRVKASMETAAVATTAKGATAQEEQGPVKDDGGGGGGGGIARATTPKEMNLFLG